MKIGIHQRFFLAILAATALAVLGMFLIIQWNIERGFIRFVNMMEQEMLERLSTRLIEEYAVQGSWDFFETSASSLLAPWPAGPGRHQLPFRGHSPFAAQPHPPEQWRPPPPPPGSPPSPLHGEWPVPPPTGPPDHRFGGPPPPHEQDFAARLILQDAARKTLYGPAQVREAVRFIPLRHGDHTVGYLGLLSRRQLVDTLQLHFISGQKTVLLLASVVVLCLAAIFSLPLARGLLRPIRELTAGTRRLAAGEYDTRVRAETTDELGLLARDFNDLAQALGKNEAARRRYMADIAHELRTPLAILRGEIEAIQDGVRQAGPETYRSLHAEVLQLGRLIEDLYQLALADAGMLQYRKQSVDIVALLHDIADRYVALFDEQGLHLTVRLPAAVTASLYADPDRLRQLFSNLLNNSLACTDRGGGAVLTLDQVSETVRVGIEDSPPGLPAEDLPNLFAPAAERPRRRSGKGGSGLGLAICRNIVEAHGGTIEARPSSLGGLHILVTLPVKEGVA